MVSLFLKLWMFDSKTMQQNVGVSKNLMFRRECLIKLNAFKMNNGKCSIKLAWPR